MHDNLEDSDMPDKLPDKIPPQSIEAEQSLLGCLMLDKDAIIKVVDFLQARDFYKGVHQEIYTAMVDIFSKGEPVDVLSVSSRRQRLFDRTHQFRSHGHPCFELRQNRPEKKNPERPNWRQPRNRAHGVCRRRRRGRAFGPG